MYGMFEGEKELVWICKCKCGSQNILLGSRPAAKLPDSKDPLQDIAELTVMIEKLVSNLSNGRDVLYDLPRTVAYTIKCSNCGNEVGQCTSVREAVSKWNQQWIRSKLKKVLVISIGLISGTLFFQHFLLRWLK